MAADCGEQVKLASNKAKPSRSVFAVFDVTLSSSPSVEWCGSRGLEMVAVCSNDALARLWPPQSGLFLSDAGFIKRTASPTPCALRASRRLQI